jgi:hypothetical protein
LHFEEVGRFGLSANVNLEEVGWRMNNIWGLGIGME